MRIAILSDTHGLLRPALYDALVGVEHIVHAGDIGSLQLLAELEAIAPVTAVWGNTDGRAVRERVPAVAEVELAGVKLVVTHGHQFGSPTPAILAEQFPDAGVVVFGHTHTPVIQRVGAVLAVNPGSVGPRRFSLPVSYAIGEVGEAGVEIQLRTLEV